MKRTYGSLTEASIGIILREIVTRVGKFVRKSRNSFESEQKGVKVDGGIDWVTNIDKAAQDYAIRLIQENLPTVGIVAEERGLSIASRAPTKRLWITFDPIDGTRAFVHRHSHGISVMLALMYGNEVIAACIYDVMTEEMFYFRPGSDKTHLLDPHSEQRLLEDDVGSRSLKDQYLLLRDPGELHDPATRRILQISPHPLFRKYETAGGSIGMSMSRLWKGEVGGAILQAGNQNPWDICPILGFTKRLGFVFFSIAVFHDLKDGQIHLIRTDLKAKRRKFPLNHDVLVIHENNIPELSQWCKEEGIELTA